MKTWLSFREKTKGFYAKYDTYIVEIWKFFLAFVSLLLINGRLGYFQRLDSIFLVLILALFASFLPMNALVVFGTVFLLGHLYAYSISALIVGGGILLIVLLLYFGTVPQEGYPLILTMLALAFGLPAATPLVFGLVSGPAAAAAICLGTVAYYALSAVNGGVPAAAAGMESTAVAAEKSKEILGEAQALMDKVMGEERLVLAAVSMLAVFLVVYLIRRMEMRHSWSIAIVIGTAAFLIVNLLGCLLFGRVGSIPMLIFGTLGSMGIAFAVKFFLFHVDYPRAMSVQFEDEDYYYYVKAIPKIKKGSEASGDN